VVAPGSGRTFSPGLVRVRAPGGRRGGQGSCNMKTKLVCLMCLVGMVVGGLLFALSALESLKASVGV